MDVQHPNPDDQIAEQAQRMTSEGGQEPAPAPDERSRIDRLMTAAREHPGLSVIAVAGLGLFGGIEVAAAVLLGAGVAALVKLPDRAPPMAGVRGRARSFVERVRNTVTKVGNEH